MDAAGLRLRQQHVRDHARLLRDEFHDQASYALSLVEMVPDLASDVDVVFPFSRFSASLAGVFFTANLATVDDFGVLTADAGVWNLPRTQNYLIATAAVAADQVITGTRSDLREALAEDDKHPAVRQVFEKLLASRLDQWAQTQTTFASNFGIHEAGQQNRMVWKQWQVTSDDSRHAELDGERVPLDRVFSNGLRFPGDVTGDVNDTAWCHCAIDVGS